MPSIKKIVKNIIIVIIFPIILIIYILRPIMIIRFGIVQSSRIGALSIQVEHYLKEMKIKKNKFVLDIISYEKQICNKKLALLVSRLPVKIINFPKKIQIFFDGLNLLSPNNFHRINFVAHPKDFFINEDITQLKFSSNEVDKARELLANIGIHKKNMWVCIHNRDSAYLNSISKNNWNHNNYSGSNWSYHNYRDFNISSMVSTCNYFLSKGYHVIRVGQKANEAINLKHPKLIDYPFINKKDELLELYLLANCSFFIGCNAGIYTIPYIFKRPLLITNYTSVGLLNQMKHNKWMTILKLFTDKNTGKILSLDEIFTRNLDNMGIINEFNDNNIKLIDNTPDEILNASIELEQRENAIWNNTEKSFGLQKKFWNKVNQYKKINKFNKNNLYISSYFLEKHQNVLF